MDNIEFRNCINNKIVELLSKNSKNEIEKCLCDISKIICEHTITVNANYQIEIYPMVVIPNYFNKGIYENSDCIKENGTGLTQFRFITNKEDDYICNKSFLELYIGESNSANYYLSFTIVRLSSDWACDPSTMMKDELEYLGVSDETELIFTKGNQKYTDSINILKKHFNFPNNLKVGDKYELCNYMKKPIIWNVLDVRGGFAYITTEKIIDYVAYDETGYRDIEKASIFNFLNSDFTKEIGLFENNVYILEFTLLSKEEIEKYYKGKSAICKDLDSDENTSGWWLRTEQYPSFENFLISYEGEIEKPLSLKYALGVRPSIWIPLYNKEEHI